MTDMVALVSVASSGAVALGGLVLTYRSGREQRTHEATLAFEERAWETKSDGLFAVITTSRHLIDTATRPKESSRNMLWSQVKDSLTALDRALPVVETYASPECRAAFDSLRHMLQAAGQPLGGAGMVRFKITKIRQSKEEAIDAGDFPKAAELRDQELKVLADATEALGIDVSQLQETATRLIDAARASMRG